MNENLKKIKDLQKKVKQSEQDMKDRNEIVEQELLQTIKGKKPTLQDLKIRPNISGRKTCGVFECHLNGFRYVTSKNEKVEITFKNIKHAFFQPCDKEMIILLHFHLYSPIMIGKKKSFDIQFYTEAGMQTEDIGKFLLYIKLLAYTFKTIFFMINFFVIVFKVKIYIFQIKRYEKKSL